MASSDLYTTGTTLAVLSAGRTPVWETLDADDALLVPSAADDGVYLEGALKTHVVVSLRAQAHRRTAVLTTSATLTGTYTITVDGTAVTYDATAGAPADLAALLAALKAALDGNGTVAALVSTTIVNSILVLRGLAEADYSISFSHSGAAVLTVVADACSADLRCWWTAGARVGSQPPEVWAWDGDLRPIDRRGRILTLCSAGRDRLHVQVSNRHGHSGDGISAGSVTYSLRDPDIHIGPALSEVE